MAPGERTPLLREVEPEPIDDGAVEQQQERIEGTYEGDDTTLFAEEPSTGKLVVILASVWVGVFLGALGMSPHPLSSVCSRDELPLTQPQTLPSSQHSRLPSPTLSTLSH
jgi:hypothetical protein